MKWASQVVKSSPALATGDKACWVKFPLLVSTAFRTTYARKMTDRLKVGGSLNYIRDVIYDADMQAIAFDVGSNFDTGIYGVMLGMSITNFGPEVQYNGESLHITVPDTIDVDERVSKITTKFPLPLVFRLGIEDEIVGPNSVFIKHPQHSLKISIDGIKPNDFTVYGTMGLEYSWQNLAFARMGKIMEILSTGMSSLQAYGETILICLLCYL